MPKEDNSLYVPNLMADTVYTFNISAKYLDGSYGASYSIRLDTGDVMMTRTTASRDLGLYFFLTVFVSWPTVEIMQQFPPTVERRNMIGII